MYITKKNSKIVFTVTCDWIVVYQTCMQDGSRHDYLSSASMELLNNPLKHCEELYGEDSELLSAKDAYCTAHENKMNSTRDVNGSKMKSAVKKTDDDKVRKASEFTSVGDSHCQSSAEQVKNVQVKITNKTGKKRKCNKADKLISALADITDQMNVSVTKPRQHKTVSGCNRCDESCVGSSEQMSLTGTYCTTSENKTDITHDISGSKTSLKKTDKFRKASKFTSVGDSQCQSSNKPKTVADEGVKDVKIKVANRTSKQQKSDKAVSVVAAINDQISVPLAKLRHTKTARTCKMCDEHCKLVSGKSGYCTVLESKTNNTQDVNRSKMKTAVKKTDAVKARKTSKITPVNDSHCQNSTETVTVTADSLKDVNMQVASKTAKKRKCYKSNKSVSALADNIDKSNASVTKHRKSKTEISYINKCTDSTSSGKADCKVSDDQFKRRKTLSSRCDKPVRHSRKLTDYSARGATKCTPVSNVNVTEDTTAIKEQSIGSCSDFCVMMSPEQRTGCFRAGGSVCKHDIAASRSNFDVTCQLSRPRNDSVICKKDCSQQKKDNAQTVKETNKQYKDIPLSSAIDVLLQTCTTNHLAFGDTRGEQTTDKENCKEVNNGSLQTADNAVKENKYTLPCRALDKTTQSCDSISHHPEKISTACEDMTTSFHMKLRPRHQWQCTEGTKRQRAASVLLSKQHCGIKTNDNCKMQEPCWNNGQKILGCTVNENKYTLPHTDLDKTTQLCDSISHHPDKISTACEDMATSFHMKLRPRRQWQCTEGTTRKRSASALVSQKHCCIKPDDKCKTQ